MYYALNGIGTFLNHMKVKHTDSVEIEQCNVEFCGSTHKCFEEKSKILRKLTLGDIKVANVMHINACCISFTNLISGRTDALVQSTKKPWDIEPGIFLLKEYGLTSVKYGDVCIYSKSKELIDFIMND